jgi:hypothetical protein
MIKMNHDTLLAKRQPGVLRNDLFDKKNPKKQEARRMTICAAAICKHEDRPALIMISDRMLTADDFEFEDSHVKFMRLAQTIACLFAGDRNYHYMVAAAAKKEIHDDNVTCVKDVADIYASHYVALRKSKAAKRVLGSIGLTTEIFSPEKQHNCECIAQLRADISP